MVLTLVIEEQPNPEEEKVPLPAYRSEVDTLKEAVDTVAEKRDDYIGLRWRAYVIDDVARMRLIIEFVDYGE